MTVHRFEDTALVILGHGSSTNERAGEPVFEQTRQLGEKNEFAEVRAAFWKQEPQIKTVLKDLRARRVAIVPLFVGKGYFSDKIIPKELGFDSMSGQVIQKGDQALYYCDPVGTHPGITALILEQAVGLINRYPFPQKADLLSTTLFLAGHGTEREPESRKSLEEHASRIREKKLFADCQAVFLEEKPIISDCYNLAKTRNLVVVPVLIGEGDHTQRDIPRMLGESERNIEKRLSQNHQPWRNPTEKRGKLVWYGTSIGAEPGMAQIIIDQVAQAMLPQPSNHT